MEDKKPRIRPPDEQRARLEAMALESEVVPVAELLRRHGFASNPAAVTRAIHGGLLALKYGHATEQGTRTLRWCTSLREWSRWYASRYGTPLDGADPAPPAGYQMAPLAAGAAERARRAAVTLTDGQRIAPSPRLRVESGVNV